MVTVKSKWGDDQNILNDHSVWHINISDVIFYVRSKIVLLLVIILDLWKEYSIKQISVGIDFWSSASVWNSGSYGSF